MIPNVFQENKMFHQTMFFYPKFKNSFMFRVRIYMLFTGWEVHVGKTCARGLEYRPRPLAEGDSQTDRRVNNIFNFFQLRFKSFRKFSFTLQPKCVEVGRLRVDEARDRLQTKTKHYNMIFSSVIYIMALTALF